MPPLLGRSERRGIAAEHVAAEPLIDQEVAQQFATVRVGRLGEQVARRTPERPAVEILDEDRRAGGHQPDLRQIAPHFGDIERLPPGVHEFVDQVAGLGNACGRSRNWRTM